jgi:hypothetical protein
MQLCSPIRRSLCAAALAAALSGAVDPAGAGARLSTPGALPPIERPEIRSYQPYSGLQYGFRPPPPAERTRPTRPRILAPAPLSPLIRPGVPHPYTAQWYAYCADKYVSFEPRTGLYTTYGGRKRLCR